MSESENPILHVIVVGFHHKKGCQVEYSYPPLVPGSPNECPPGWKYLPTLALPDGSHNFENDTAYFHLSSLTDPRKTVFGISCYRQIPVEKLKIKTDDITRSTVQKAVCVLSTLSLYGHIQVKMSLITHAYFEEGDFSKVTLLEDTFHHLNSCLSQTQIPSQIFVGLSARDLILQWRHKAVLLFKLLLLEKRLIFYKSPVQPLCSTILTLLSLHPGMIERGLDQSACVKPSRPMSPIPDFEESADEDVPNMNNPQIEDLKTNSPTDIEITNPKTNFEKTNSKAEVEKLNKKPEIENSNIKNEVDNVSIIEQKVESLSQNVTPLATLNQNKMHLPSTTSKSNKEASSLAENMVPNNIIDTEKADAEKTIVEGSGILGVRDERPTLPRDTSIDTLVDVTAQNTMTTIAHINAEECGAPLEIFTHGYLCFPYLSLPYMDLLSDCNVRGYIVGATNVLFKQKRQLSDVLIEVDGTRIESLDPELRRQLHLTTEDLRFADFVVKHVSEERHDVFLDGVGWEGGDEWIRSQFRVYLLCLLRTSLLQDNCREIEHFNSSFISAWKDTHNYKTWISGEHSNILELNPGHPFAGQLSVADMKLRLAHTMQNTESGRKINQAMVSTGRAVATTGRAVGGAFTQAKGALSNWWSNLTTVSPENDQMVNNEQNMENETGIPEQGEDIVNNENQQNVLQDEKIDKKHDIETIAQKQRIIEPSDISKKSDNCEVIQKNEVNVQNNLDDKNSRIHDEILENVYKPGEINTV